MFFGEDFEQSQSGCGVEDLTHESWTESSIQTSEPTFGYDRFGHGQKAQFDIGDRFTLGTKETEFFVLDLETHFDHVDRLDDHGTGTAWKASNEKMPEVFHQKIKRFEIKLICFEISLVII